MDYRNRRKKLMEDLEDGSMALLFSGKAPVRSADEAYPFVVNRSFYYMTGIDRENMTLLLIKEDDEVNSLLFIEPYDPVMARWVAPPFALYILLQIISLQQSQKNFSKSV